MKRFSIRTLMALVVVLAIGLAVLKKIGEVRAARVHVTTATLGSSRRHTTRRIAEYDDAIRFDPKNALAYFGRAYSWAWKSDYDRAIADFNEAIRLDPTEVGACSYRADAWQ